MARVHRDSFMTDGASNQGRLTVRFHVPGRGVQQCASAALYSTVATSKSSARPWRATVAAAVAQAAAPRTAPRHSISAGSGWPVGALDHLPEVAVAGAVVQVSRWRIGAHCALLARRSRISDGRVDLGRASGERLDDGADLVGVDLPHARVAELAAGVAAAWRARRSPELGDHAVRRHLAGHGRPRRSRVGAQHQRVRERPSALIAWRDRAAMRRDEVHQAGTATADARMAAIAPPRAPRRAILNTMHRTGMSRPAPWMRDQWRSSIRRAAHR